MVLAPGHPTRPGAASGASALWGRAGRHPLIVVTLIVVAQFGLTLWSKDLWFSDEARHGGVLLEMLNGGHWLALHLNGQLYPDKPPLYFWYLAAIWKAFGTTAPWGMYLGLAGTAAMFYLAAFHMARRLTGSRDLALLGLVILASGVYLVLIGHYARMDMAFSAAIVLSWGYLFTGLAGAAPERRALIAGFAWMAVAAMIKGPVGVLFPLVSLVGFALWLGRARWLGDRAVLGGLALVIGVIALWAGGLVWAAGPEFLAHLVETQIVERGLEKTTTPLGVAFYAIVMPVNFLPWTFLALLVPWRWRGLAPDTAYLWISVLGGAFALTLISEKHSYYMVPLLAPMALLAAKGYSALNPVRTRIFWTLALSFTAFFAGLLVLGPWFATRPEINLGDYRPAVRTLFWPGVGLLSGALALTVMGAGHPRQRAAGYLAVQCLYVTLTALAVFPALNRVLSPAQVTDAMRPYLEQGYVPAGFHGRDAVFAYHMGMAYQDVAHPRHLRGWLEETPRAVVFMAHTNWWLHRDRLEGLGPVACVRFANRGMIVLAKPAPDPPRAITRDRCETPLSERTDG